METIYDHAFHEDAIGKHPDIAGIIPSLNSTFLCRGERLVKFDNVGECTRVSYLEL